MTLILSVAIGVGIMLVIAMLRIVFNVRLKYLLLGFYAAVFILAIFVPESFLSISCCSFSRYAFFSYLVRGSG